LDLDEALADAVSGCHRARIESLEELISLNEVQYAGLTRDLGSR
jgi:hypothetical protein